MTDKAEIRRNSKLAQARQLRIDNAVRAMLQHSDTREYLWWLLEIGKVGHNPFSSRREHTDFQCGELNVGLQVFAHLMEVNPEGYSLLIKENQNATRGSIRPSGDPADSTYGTDAPDDPDSTN